MIGKKPIRIGELLERLRLGDSFDTIIAKQGQARNMRAGTEGEKFIYSKLDDLKAYVTARMTDNATDEELKILISGWLEAQNYALEKELNDAWIKSLEEETT